MLDAGKAGTNAGDDQDLGVLISDIRRIGHRLQCLQALNHPRVRTALNQLDEQLASSLGQGRGRHRLAASGSAASIDGGGGVSGSWSET